MFIKGLVEEVKDLLNTPNDICLRNHLFPDFRGFCRNTHDCQLQKMRRRKIQTQTVILA